VQEDDCEVDPESPGLSQRAGEDTDSERPDEILTDSERPDEFLTEELSNANEGRGRPDEFLVEELPNDAAGFETVTPSGTTCRVTRLKLPSNIYDIDRTSR
jgi:hypothetical protein